MCAGVVNMFLTCVKLVTGSVARKRNLPRKIGSTAENVRMQSVLNFVSEHVEK